MELFKSEESDTVNKLSVFLESYVTENELNSYIKKSQSLSMLQTALEIKLNLITQKKHTRTYFPISNILEQLSSTNIEEVCHVLHLALKVQNNDVQYMILLEYINKNLRNKEECILINTLKLLQLGLSLCELRNLQETFEQFSLNKNFCSTICNLLTNDSKTVINFMCVCILPKYLRFDSRNAPYIFGNVRKNTIKSKNLDVVCAVPEFFIASDTSPFYIFSFVNIEKFWLLLQECLGSNNSSIQKQSLYLLKRAVHSLKNEKHFQTEQKVVFWDMSHKKEIDTAWQNLFILLEISREKQLHLIEPAYQLLSTIKILHSSWIICIYNILLSHPHGAVSAYAVTDLLNYEWYQDANTFEEVIKCFLPSLNKMEYVQKEEIWTKLCEFIKKLDNDKFTVVLQESANVSWVPPICYLLYRSIFLLDRTMSISFELIESILKNTERIPHKFIRTECAKLVRNFMYRAFLSYKTFDFKEYITLCWILYRDEHIPCEESLDIRFEEHVLSIREIIKSWILNKSIDVKEVKTVLKILELHSLENDWLEENVLKPFIEKKFVIEISDRFCIFLYSKGINCDIIQYLQDMVVNLNPANETVIRDMLPVLIPNKENQTGLSDLFETCAIILLMEVNNIIQIEVAFEIVLFLYQKCKSVVKINLVDDIIKKWKEKFCKGVKECNMHICTSFLYLYCDKELNYDKSSSRCIISRNKLIEIITLFEKMMDTQSNDVIPEIFTQLKYMLDLSEDFETVFNFTNTCLHKLAELKRTDIFKIAVENFTATVFSNSKICQANYNNEQLFENSVNIAWALLDLAKFYDDVAFSLAIHLCNLSKYHSNAIMKFIPIVVELLLFGDVLKKDQRAEYIVCQKIAVHNQGVIDDNNPIFRRLSIRGQSVVIIHNLLSKDCSTKEQQFERADALTLILMEKYSAHFNKRYFADSQVHLQKLRILQALLVVHNYIRTQRQPLINLLLNSVCSESHQISIRFLIIWLLVRLLCDNEQCLTIITEKMESTSKVHSSTIIAFIPVLYHIALWKNDTSFFTHLFEIMLPWTMGAHFNLRLYAQEGIVKLYQAVQQRGYSKVCEKFETPFTCVLEVLEKTERRIDIVDRYIFDKFNAQDHYNLQTIYFDIPLITNVTCDEYENLLCIPEFNAGIKLHDFDTKQWLNQTVEKSSESFKQESRANIIQKKITPQTNFSEDQIQRKVGELVVVASLIDKTPNLGGLSRTCEIFGVKQLVVNTMNVIKSHEFQSVSMSSEKWVEIIEIKVDHLQTFLSDMKQTGYSIVGAEQTSDSTKLNIFQFPKKSLLLLGNEKEGIPPNLLALIDTCVEIPQFGVVRSLNVHVAAATFIWDYTKQHVV